MLDLRDKIQESIEVIRHYSDIEPEIALTLGSGLGSLVDKIKDKVVIPYGDLPNFPETTVEGHQGNLVIGELNGKKVVVMQGRTHYYEGYVLKTITFPVRVLKGLGAEIFIITNAAGALNSSYQVGDLVLITDHINMTFANPLIGPNDDFLGPRFPDMSEAYDKDLINLSLRIGDSEGIGLKKGIYIGVSGPNYETPAELKFLNLIGGDLVGMSTIHETIVARHAGLRILGISCVTDMALYDKPIGVSHADVLEEAVEASPRLIKLIEGIVRET
jgi:purine-nucleoside phosphorylase